MENEELCMENEEWCMEYQEWGMVYGNGIWRIRNESPHELSK